MVVPAGLLAKIKGRPVTRVVTDTQASGARARAVIMETERALGFEPTDRELEKLGYDVESRIPGEGRLRFIEVKGRVSGADTITVTKNEILCQRSRRFLKKMALWPTSMPARITWILTG